MQLTTKSSGNKQKTPAKTTPPPIKLISENRKVRQRFEILGTLECGMILQGSEVKSLRNGKCSLDEAYARLRDQTLWLIGCDIAPYAQASVWNHEPKRPRKLLVHRIELTKFAGRAKEKGLTIVPLRIYFNARGIAKCEIALCKGLKMHDKREKLKKADAQRDMQRAVRKRRT